jgi:hypothetical protein
VNTNSVPDSVGVEVTAVRQRSAKSICDHILEVLNVMGELFW